MFWLAPLIGAAITGIAYPYLFGRHEALADRPAREMNSKLTTTRVRTERGRPDPVSDLVEVAQETRPVPPGSWYRYRGPAPRIPLSAARALVFGAGGDYWDYPPALPMLTARLGWIAEVAASTEHHGPPRLARLGHGAALQLHEPGGTGLVSWQPRPDHLRDQGGPARC